MNKLFLFGVLAVFSLSFTSCLKEYDCKCPTGTQAKVKTVSKAEAKKTCEETTLGICTL